MGCEHDQKKYGMMLLPKEANGCFACHAENLAARVEELEGCEWFIRLTNDNAELRGTIATARDLLLENVGQLEGLLALCKGEAPSLLEDHHQWSTITEALKKGNAFLAEREGEHHD